MSSDKSDITKYSDFFDRAWRVSGLVKLKKNKNPRKTRINQTSPTHPPIYIYFLETFENIKTTQKTHTKNNIKKKKIELGLDPPTHFRVLLGFLNFEQNSSLR